jgi:hypothetical protein
MLAIVVGLMFAGIGVWGVAVWYSDFIVVVRGIVPVLLFCGGMLSVVAGITSLKDQSDDRALTRSKSGDGKKDAQ